MIPPNIVHILDREIPIIPPGESITYTPVRTGSCCSKGPINYLRLYCHNKGYKLERVGTDAYRITNTTDPIVTDAPRKTLASKIASFLDAITGPKVPVAVYSARLAVCQSNSCGYLIREGNRMFCGACECPHYSLAELTNKLYYANLECPTDPPWWHRHQMRPQRPA